MRRAGLTTIEPFDARTGLGTGFKFEKYDAKPLFASIRQALKTYANSRAWQNLQTNCMARDFSWRASADEYAGLYEVARKARNLHLASSSNWMVQNAVAAGAYSQGKGIHGR